MEKKLDSKAFHDEFLNSFKEIIESNPNYQRMLILKKEKDGKENAIKELEKKKQRYIETKDYKSLVELEIQIKKMQEIYDSFTELEDGDNIMDILSVEEKKEIKKQYSVTINEMLNEINNKAKSELKKAIESLNMIKQIEDDCFALNEEMKKIQSYDFNLSVNDSIQYYVIEKIDLIIDCLKNE